MSTLRKKHTFRIRAIKRFMAKASQFLFMNIHTMRTHYPCYCCIKSNKLKIAVLLFITIQLLPDQLQATHFHPYDTLTSSVDRQPLEYIGTGRAKTPQGNKPHYNPFLKYTSRQTYNITPASIFGTPLRPFSINQQSAIIELLATHNITNHNYILSTMVKMTQYTGLSELDHTQIQQAIDWRQNEGNKIIETACLNNSMCKEQTIQALSQIGMYDTQIPPMQHYDYTLFLGGSIQEMQWRMLVLLSLYKMSLNNKNFDLGEIVALTCNRLVLKEEAEELLPVTFFNITVDDHGRRALISNDDKAVLTETTGYLAIYHSLKMFSTSDDYFRRFQETSSGYHPIQPVSFLARDSIEDTIYKKDGHTFKLSDNLPKLLKSFLKRYPESNFYETPQKMAGASLVIRPTTKKTVREWLKSNNNTLKKCINKKPCRILVISNSPSAIYQHIAVLQALEESIEIPGSVVYELSTAGAGASTDIPTNALLDNLTKLMYLEDKHPKN